MNFYVSTSELIQTFEGLEKNLGFLAERAFRISPRDSRANREILEQCAAKVEEAKDLLEGNPHIGKTPLRHAALLLQIFHLSFQRMNHLANAVANLAGKSEDEARAIQHLFSEACRQLGTLQKVLSGLAGIPLTLELRGNDGKKQGQGVFQTEESLQRESLTLLDKATEIFDEDPELLDVLMLIRQELVESKKKIRKFGAAAPAPKPAVPTTALSQG